MTLAQLLEQARITQVWRALGGGEIRHGRGQAFWRNGDGYNVSLNDKIGAWHDFPTDDKGGILDLIRRVRGGSRAEAAHWLADLLGVRLDSGRLPQVARRRFAHARQHAPELARAAFFWWRARREELETRKEKALAAGDFVKLEHHASEHYRLSKLGLDDVVLAYVHAKQENPRETATLIAKEEFWAEFSEAGIIALIGRWTREAEAA
jgi:hypothetical protein